MADLLYLISSYKSKYNIHQLFLKQPFNFGMILNLQKIYNSTINSHVQFIQIPQLFTFCFICFTVLSV